MNMLRKVIVNVTIPTIQHPDDNTIFIAMISELPLTGFGPTANEAREGAKVLLRRFIDVHRQRGTLENILNRAAIEWYWEDEYPSDHPEPEDLNQLITPQEDFASVVRDDQRDFVAFLISQTTDYWERTSFSQAEAPDLMVAA